jgi:hypothetical protein
LSKRVRSISATKASIEAAPIMPAADQPLAQLCPDLQSWPQRWRYQESDIALGERLVECFTPFLVHLLGQSLSLKTLQRHRDHLWVLGGEIIRRLQDEPNLQHSPAKTIVLESMDPECGPLIWPRITQQQQGAFDATCRKLYKYLTAAP